jgi:hypothetical protein
LGIENIKLHRLITAHTVPTHPPHLRALPHQSYHIPSKQISSHQFPLPKKAHFSAIAEELCTSRLPSINHHSATFPTSSQTFSPRRVYPCPFCKVYIQFLASSQRCIIETKPNINRPRPTLQISQARFIPYKASVAVLLCMLDNPPSASEEGIGEGLSGD